MPPSSQGATVPYTISTYSSLVPSPGPSFSHGSGYLPIRHQDLLTHLSRSAGFLSPGEYTVPVTPSLGPYSQAQAISNPDGLDFCLSSKDPTLAYDPTWGNCKPTVSRPQNLVPVSTIRDIVLPEQPSSDPVGSNPLSSDLITVSGSIASVSVIRLHDSVGCDPT